MTSPTFDLTKQKKPTKFSVIEISSLENLEQSEKISLVEIYGALEEQLQLQLVLKFCQS